jgi:hypothetical protein
VIETPTRRRQQKSIDAETRFLARITELGATLADGSVYRGKDTPVRLKCSEGHDCNPTPSNAKRWGICYPCGQADQLATPRSLAAKAAFLTRIAELGATLAPDAVYKGTGKPISVFCAQGHLCRPRPASLQRGQGICVTCAGKDSSVAEAGFLARITELGATLADGATYRGAGVPVALICAAGHQTSATWVHIQTVGRGICRICAGHDPAATEAAFWARVAELGATPAPGATYRGKDTSVPLVCANGHACNPRPGCLQQGQGPCMECIKTFDRVYLMLHDATQAIKVGISGNDGRVKRNGGRGYQLVTQWRSLTHTQAVDMERLTLSWWRSQGWQQVDACPKNGRTETTTSDHLQETLVWMTAQMSPRLCYLSGVAGK